MLPILLNEGMMDHITCVAVVENEDMDYTETGNFCSILAQFFAIETHVLLTNYAEEMPTLSTNA
jgi:hypothetical protein